MTCFKSDILLILLSKEIEAYDITILFVRLCYPLITF
jgi:hypothetical protein